MDAKVHFWVYEMRVLRADTLLYAASVPLSLLASHNEQSYPVTLPGSTKSKLYVRLLWYASLWI